MARNKMTATQRQLRDRIAASVTRLAKEMMEVKDPAVLFIIGEELNKQAELLDGLALNIQQSNRLPAETEDTVEAASGA